MRKAEIEIKVCMNQSKDIAPNTHPTTNQMNAFGQTVSGSGVLLDLEGQSNGTLASTLTVSSKRN